MAIDEAGLADLALDFSKLMEIKVGQAAEDYEASLNSIVIFSQFMEKELERGNIDGKFAVVVKAYSERCAELLIDARLRGV